MLSWPCWPTRASYFARGWLAGHQWFGLYGALVFMEATSRLLFAVAVAIGIASGQTVGRDGHGRGAVRLAGRRARGRSRAGRRRAPRKAETDEEALDLARGGRFAVAVLCIMIAEQTLLNGGVLAADINATDAAVAGYVFNALLIARAPLQLFQAVQGSLLPHLAGLEATEGRDEFNKAIRITILAIAGFAGAVAIGLLIVGPFAMSVLFDDNATYGRLGLAAVAIGMGAHLAAGHAQPGRARPRPRRRGRRRLADQRRRLRRLDAARRRRRRADAGRGGLPRRRVVVVRAPGRRLPAARRVTRDGHLRTAAAGGMSPTRPEPLTMPGVTQSL